MMATKTARLYTAKCTPNLLMIVRTDDDVGAAGDHDGAEDVRRP
jgi:hypothetical protein